MSVAYDSVGPSSSGAVSAAGATSLSWSHTCGVSANCLVVVVVNGNGSEGTDTVTYDGVPMTLQIKVYSNAAGSNTLGYVSLWTLLNPATGSAETVAVSCGNDASPGVLIGGSVSYTDVGAFGIPVSTSADGAVSSLSLGVVTADITGMVAAGGCCGSAFSTVTQTERWLLNENDHTAANNGAQQDAASTGGTVTFEWEIADSDWFGAVAVELLAAVYLVSDIDSGTGLDTGVVTAYVSSSDTGTGSDADTYFLPQPQADTGAGLDTVTSFNVTLLSPDTGTGLDAGAVTAHVSSSDTGTGSELQVAQGYGVNVAFDAVGPSSAGTSSAAGGTSLSWTHVCGSLATCLVVVVANANGAENSIDAVTYGGVPMNRQGWTYSNSPGGNTSGYVALWTLLDPPAGSNTVAATVNSDPSPGVLIGGSVSYTGVAAFGTPVTASPSGNVTSVSTPVATTRTTGMVVGGACGGSPFSSVTGTGRWLDNVNALSNASNAEQQDSQSGGGTVTLEWLGPSDWYGAVALELQAAVFPSSDSGTGSDTYELILPLADSGSGLDIGYAGASSHGADSGTGLETWRIAVSSTDSGSGLDISYTAVASTDAGTGSDTWYVIPGIPGADSGTGLDTGLVAGSVVPQSADTGSGLDTASISALTFDVDGVIPYRPGIGPDTVTGITVLLADTDFGSGSDTDVYILAQQQVDTGSGADTGVVTAYVSIFDTGTGSDTDTYVRHLQQADTGAGLDTVTSFNAKIFSADSGSGLDAGAVTASVSGADSGTGSDTYELILLLTDSGNGTETQGLTALVSGTEAATAAELVGTIRLLALDAAAGIDGQPSIVAAVSNAEVAAGTESSGLAAVSANSDTAAGSDSAGSFPAVSSDLGSGADASQMTVASPDTGTGTEFGVAVLGGYTIVFSSDYGVGQEGDTEGYYDVDAAMGAETGVVAVSRLSDYDLAAGDDEGSAFILIQVTADQDYGRGHSREFNSGPYMDTDAGTGIDMQVVVLSDIDSASGADEQWYAIEVFPFPPPWLFMTGGTYFLVWHPGTPEERVLREFPVLPRTDYAALAELDERIRYSDTLVDVSDVDTGTGGESCGPTATLEQFILGSGAECRVDGEASLVLLAEAVTD